MTKTGELDPEAVKLRGILTQLVRISNTLHNCAKKGDKPFTGWAVCLCDICHSGSVERTINVFDGYLRVSESSHDAELVLTDTNGITAIVLPCSSISYIKMPSRRKAGHYRLQMRSGATLILAA